MIFHHSSHAFSDTCSYLESLAVRLAQSVTPPKICSMLFMHFEALVSSIINLHALQKRSMIQNEDEWRLSLLEAYRPSVSNSFHQWNTQNNKGHTRGASLTPKKEIYTRESLSSRGIGVLDLGWWPREIEVLNLGESRGIEVRNLIIPEEGDFSVMLIPDPKLCYGFSSDVTHARFEIHTNGRSEWSAGSRNMYEVIVAAKGACWKLS